MIKILFVGSGNNSMYEKALYSSARKIEEIETDIFMWSKYLSTKSIMDKIQNKFSFGYKIYTINKALKRILIDKKYDIVFLYSARHIYDSTVKKISENSFVAVYNNDDPFSKYFPKYFWRHFIKSIKYASICYIYREKNRNDFYANGAKKIKLLRSYYDEEKNYYISEKLTHDVLDIPDVVFMGHYENDGRKEYLNYLVENGIKVGVPRTEWIKSGIKNSNLIFIDNSHDNYNKILNKSKIALVFLSKINNDTYTRRCFEIPVTKTLMISIYSQDIENLFKKDDEIVFFSDKYELHNKITYYLNNENERLKVVENSYKRVLRDGHSSIARVRSILQDYKETINYKE